MSDPVSDDQTVRDAIARALYDLARAQEPEQVADYYPEADAALAALAAAGYAIVTTDDWEWGLYNSASDTEVLVDSYHEPLTQETAWDESNSHWRPARRRPAGPWEVVPDAR